MSPILKWSELPPESLKPRSPACFGDHLKSSRIIWSQIKHLVMGSLVLNLWIPTWEECGFLQITHCHLPSLGVLVPLLIYSILGLFLRGDHEKVGPPSAWGSILIPEQTLGVTDAAAWWHYMSLSDGLWLSFACSKPEWPEQTVGGVQPWLGPSWVWTQPCMAYDGATCWVLSTSVFRILQAGDGGGGTSKVGRALALHET